MTATTYAYKVRDAGGNVVEGNLDADSEQLLVARLRSMGYTPISVAAQKADSLNREINIPFLQRRTIKLKDIAVFSRQFATMIDSGLSLLRSLAILTEQTEDERLAAVIGQVRTDVEQGANLSGALARHPEAFNRLFVAMVRAGEVGGSLDRVLLRLAETIERQVELRRKVRSAMTYPVVVGVLVVGIVSAMLLFVIPMFEDIYKQLGGTLPAPTRILIGISAVVRSWWWAVTALWIGGVYGTRRWLATPAGRAQWDAWKLRAPVFGPLVRITALSRFARTFAALVRSGVPILEALDIVADTSGNEVVATAVRDGRQAIEHGEPLARRLETHDVFPAMVTQMMAVGEETGAVDTMLDKIADFYDQEIEATVAALTSLIEPLLIVIMGSCVGGMVVSLYLPMFNIIKLIK